MRRVYELRRIWLEFRDGALGIVEVHGFTRTLQGGSLKSPGAVGALSVKVGGFRKPSRTFPRSLDSGKNRSKSFLGSWDFQTRARGP